MRAHHLYMKVLELDAPAADVRKARFRLAHCSERQGDWNRAITEWDVYLALENEDGAANLEIAEATDPEDEAMLAEERQE